MKTLLYSLMISGLLTGTVAQANHHLPRGEQHDHHHSNNDQESENSGFSTTTKVFAGVAGAGILGAIAYFIYTGKFSNK